MKRIIGPFLFLCMALPVIVPAQSMLPDFSVRELTKGKIQISWNNPYRNCIQLAIQRSSDSSKNFRTIFSAQSPELVSNGFVDNRPLLGIVSYYRIFFTLDGGNYYFTKSIAYKPEISSSEKTGMGQLLPTDLETAISNLPEKDLTSIYYKKAILFRLNREAYQRFKDSINTKTHDKLHRLNEYAVQWEPAIKTLTDGQVEVYLKNKLLATFDQKSWVGFRDSVKTQTKDTLFTVNTGRFQLLPYTIPSKYYLFIYRNDSLLAALENWQYKKFKDSIALQTRDTLYVRDGQHVDIHPFVVKYVWRPSVYIFTNGKGYVTIRLPEVKQHRYHVVFYEEDGSELFRIKSLKEPELILDKTDFIHAGWFFFELFEDDKLKEKNKFLLTKE